MSGTVCKDRPFGECAVCPGDIAGAAAHFLYREKALKELRQEGKK
ncbi:hypothetical protein [Blautia sp. An81]|nr:hypothetical protein [Blautia sp. An81]